MKKGRKEKKVKIKFKKIKKELTKKYRNDIIIMKERELIKMEKEYIVYITETLEKRVVVKAKDSQNAIEEVSTAYYNEEIILDSSDYLDCSFDVIEKQ